MASATDTPLDTLSPANEHGNASSVNASSRANFRGGQGGFRGGQHRGSRGARRNGRGRGDYSSGGNNQQQRGVSTVQNQPAPPLPPPPGLGGGGSFGSRLTKDAETNEGEVTKKGNGEEEDVEAEVCFICASTVVHNSVAPCNHRTCHICALRLRALYKNKACAHCRVREPERQNELFANYFYRPNQSMSSSLTTLQSDMKTLKSRTLA